VAHVKYTAQRAVNEAYFVAQVNQKLPADITVVAAEPKPVGFHARHDATAREYVYQIATRKTSFEKKYVWWIKETLDVELMQKGAALIVGRHDFKCFQAQDPGRPAESSIVVVEKSQIEVLEDRLLFRIAASHFVWRMVRRLTGVLVKLGRHEITIEDLEQLLKGKEDARLDVAAWTAPSSGLFFERVEYR
jgi:tRNA pseudouridine38-40 synthase